jgi:hypothetical protein
MAFDRPPDNILDVVVGQRSEPALGGDKPHVVSYAGMGVRHVLALADASTGPMPTRMAPQRAAAALVARLRTSLYMTAEERLLEAFSDAHDAVRQAAVGTHAQGRAGAGLVAALVDAGGVTFGRIGAGRAFLVLDGHARAVFDAMAHGLVGDGRTLPQIVRHDRPLPPGARVVLISDGAAHAVAGDLADLVVRAPPQLAAVRVVEAARHRGRREGLACLVLEVVTDLLRSHHPAVEKVTAPEEAPLTDERGLVRTPPRRPRRIQTATGRGSAGGLWLALLASMAVGAVTALLTHPMGPAPQAASTAPEARPQATPVAPAQAADVPAPQALAAAASPDSGDGSPDASGDEDAATQALPPKVAESLERAFAADSVKHASWALRRHLRKRFRRIGYPAYDEASAWVRAHRSPRVVAVLAYLLKGKPPQRTQRWLAKLLPELYAAAAAGLP